MEKECVLKDTKIVGSPIIHLVSMAILLFAFWMGLAGRTEVKFIIYGLLTAGVTSWITYPLLLLPNKDGSKKYFALSISIPKFISYVVWLMWQLLLANLDVMKATTSEVLDIDPKVVRFYFRVDNPMAKVVLADSITLTPGTVTLNVTEDGLFEVHALTVGAATGVADGSFQRKVAELYGEKLDFELVEGEE